MKLIKRWIEKRKQGKHGAGYAFAACLLLKHGDDIISYLEHCVEEDECFGHTDEFDYGILRALKDYSKLKNKEKCS